MSLGRAGNAACAGVITVFVSACCLRVQRAGKELHSCLILCIQSGLLCSDLRVCVHVCGCACAGAYWLQSRVWSVNTWGSPLDTVRLYWCLNTRLQARERGDVKGFEAVCWCRHHLGKYKLLPFGKSTCFNSSGIKKKFSDAYFQVNIEVVILKLLGILFVISFPIFATEVLIFFYTFAAFSRWVWCFLKEIRLKLFFPLPPGWKLS